MIISCCWNGPRRPRKETLGTGDQRMIQNHLDHNNFMISYNSKDLRRFSVTQTSEKKQPVKTGAWTDYKKAYDMRLPQNVLDIRQSHNVHRGNHEERESRTDIRR